MQGKGSDFSDRKIHTIYKENIFSAFIEVTKPTKIVLNGTDIVCFPPTAEGEGLKRLLFLCKKKYSQEIRIFMIF